VTEQAVILVLGAFVLHTIYQPGQSLAVIPPEVVMSVIVIWFIFYIKMNVCLQSIILQ